MNEKKINLNAKCNEEENSRQVNKHYKNLPFSGWYFGKVLKILRKLI